MPSSSDSFPMENNIALQVENDDVNVNSKSHYQEHHDHPQSSRTTTATPIWHQGGAGVYGVMKPFIIQPSSIVITKEFKDRIAASSLASITTFVTLSLLMLTGQGRGYTCMRSPMLFVHSIAFHCTPHHNTSPFSSIIVFHSLVSSQGYPTGGMDWKCNCCINTQGDAGGNFARGT